MHARLALTFALALVLSLSACAGTPADTAEAPPAEATPEPAEAELAPEEPLTATPKPRWVDDRVFEAKARLEQSEAGKIVWRSIEAHGGLERWFENGPVYFRFDYRPLEGKVRDTYQLVDTWSSRARHQLADRPDVEFGWDGEVAWKKPAEAETGMNERFWALTPYYFMAMPFVLADPGVELESLGQATMPEGTFDVVRASYGQGVGDSPDDYYVVYFDAQTGIVGGLRYVVSYPGFFPDGGHSPEKLMMYEGSQSAGGITLANSYSTYAWDAEAHAAGKPARGDKVTDVDLSELEFRPQTPDAYFEVPEGAEVLEGY